MAGTSVTLQDVMDSAGLAMRQATAAQLDIQSNAQAYSGSIKDSQKRIDAVADAAALTANVAGTGQLQLEQAVSDTHLAYGEGLGDPAGNQLQRSKDFIAAQEARTEALRAVNQKKAVSFWDDPLGWIGVQLTINDDIAKYNSTVDEVNNIRAKVAETDELLDKSTRAQLRQKPTVTAASVQANTEAARQKILIESDAAIRDGILHSTAAIKDIQSLSAQQLSFRTQVFHAENASEQIRLAQENLALHQEEFNWKKIQQEHAMAADKYVVDTINRGLLVFDSSYPPLDAQKTAAILGTLKGGRPLDPFMQQMYELGSMNARVDSSGVKSHVLAPTPFDYLKIADFKPALSPDSKATADIILGVRDKLLKPGTDYSNAIQAKQFDQAKLIFNKAAQAAYDSSAQVVQGPGSPNYLASVDVLTEQSPRLKELTLYQKVLAPAIAAKMDLKDPAVVAQLGIKAVQNKDITSDQFVKDFTTIYRTAQDINLESKQIKNFGLVPNFTYKTDLKEGLFGREPPDWTSREDVQRYMMTSVFGLDIEKRMPQFSEAIQAAITPATAEQRDVSMFPPYGFTASRNPALKGNK